jgi:acyl-CoA:6-aminopenicillanic acid acyl transferase
MSKRSIYRRVRIPLAALLSAVAVWTWLMRGPTTGPLDTCPASYGDGSLAYTNGQLVLRLKGSPKELGEQHGFMLKQSIQRMVQEYVNGQVCDGDEEYLARLLRAVRRMKPSLPTWYSEELDACARAADVDPDMLLLAQSEGCIREICAGGRPEPACSSYVAFGRPKLSDGGMRVGRNLDYMSSGFVRNCAMVMYVEPEGGHAFVSVGWTGILGGWTFVNEWGLTLACHLGGGTAHNATGLPSLVLLRMMAQEARSIEEALAILRKTPRMRGQIIWMAQPADPGLGREPRAVAVEYDAEKLYVREAVDGILVVTNANLVFGRKEDRLPPGGRYRKLHGVVARATGDDGPLIATVADASTIHSVEVDFRSGRFFVAHGHLPAHSGPFVEYALPTRK